MDLNKIKWEIIPNELPKVFRNCPKCNEKTNFINTENFRINANGNLLDIWLIYQCERCKSTWKLAIYERVKPKSIFNEEYERFLANDKELAKAYGFDKDLHIKNKAEWVINKEQYHVIEQQVAEFANAKGQIIELSCKSQFPIRLDKLLSKQLGLSRAQIRIMTESGEITSIPAQENLCKTKLRDGLLIQICGVNRHELKKVRD